MPGIAGFILGFVAGAVVAVLLIAIAVERARHFHKEESPRSSASSAAAPSFTIGLELPKDRIVEVGMSQAFREEAARQSRLN